MDATYDVVIIGGAFSGASTGLLLRRNNPGLRVLIIERTEAFDRKVGESTTEVSSGFLTRTLGLAHYLSHHQLTKQGLRMWFCDSPDGKFDECAEIGGGYNSRISGFQVDRATLDEHILQEAVKAGCELWRPVKVESFELGGIGKNKITVKRDGVEQTVTSKWLVDASGRATLIARKHKTLEMMKEHPTNAIWARFTNVKDWDGYELHKKYPCWAKRMRTQRGLATNHLNGLGWWCWIIPLKGGDVSVGLVYDTRLFKSPEGRTIGDRLKAHFQCHPVGREILGEAQVREDDQKAYSQLPYRVEKTMGDGWAIVGDAAGFIDPLYSPGLDFCSFTAFGVQHIVGMSCEGKDVSEEIARYSDRFAFCFRSWFEGIYRDKYYYLGDAELMSAAILLDIAAYHLGPVKQVYEDPMNNYAAFPFDGKAGQIASTLISFYNRRLVVLAKKKIAAGIYGNKNTNHRLVLTGFTPQNNVSGKLLFKGIGLWLKMEFASLLWPKSRKYSVMADAVKGSGMEPAKSN